MSNSSLTYSSHRPGLVLITATILHTIRMMELSKGMGVRGWLRQVTTYCYSSAINYPFIIKLLAYPFSKYLRTF